MRKATVESTAYFMNGIERKIGNTEIKVEGGLVKMYLFNNLIAVRELNDKQNIKITLAGYNTNTTRERLNGLPFVKVTQKNFTPYLNGVEINSHDWYTV